MEFVKLFEPIILNGLSIRNRIVMPAMGMAYTRDYSFTDRLRAFYRERARGGVGLMTIGPVAIDTRGSAPLMPGLFLDEQVAPIRAFTDELHRETDVKLATQLMHMGRYAFSFLTGEMPIAPSPLASKLTGETPREMTEDDIREVQAWDVLMERVPDIGRNVVIIGGSATGCETAHFLAAMDAPDPAVFTFLMYHAAEDPASARKLLHASGRTVTVVEMVDRVAGNVGRTARWSLLKSLRLMGVSLKTGTRLVEIAENEVVLETPAGREALPADTVILAAGARSVNDLTSELAGTSGIRVITLGDAQEPRKLSDAVREGFEEALKINDNRPEKGRP